MITICSQMKSSASIRNAILRTLTIAQNADLFGIELPCRSIVEIALEAQRHRHDTEQLECCSIALLHFRHGYITQSFVRLSPLSVRVN